MPEWVGWLATLVFAVSYFFREPKTLRWIQAFAALLWIAYGVFIHSRPVMVANVIVATRSGTNNLHGNVFYYNRNTAYNANEWFNNFNGKPRPDLKLNEYGFQVGGPVIKNKTFFFGTFQNNLIKQTAPINSTNVGVFGFPGVYTSMARTGKFSICAGNSDGQRHELHAQFTRPRGCQRHPASRNRCLRWRSHRELRGHLQYFCQ